MEIKKEKGVRNSNKRKSKAQRKGKQLFSKSRKQLVSGQEDTGHQSLLFSCSVVSDSLRLTGYIPPGSSVRVIFQARMLKWVTISFPRGSSQSRDQTHTSCAGRQILYH